MKLILDFLSLFLFFLTYSLTHDMIKATVVCIITGVVQAVVIWLIDKKLDPIQLGSLILIIIFGGVTIISRDPLYIKLKPTFLYWSIVLLLSAGLIWKKNFIKIVLGDKLNLADKDWTIITVSWSIFFLILGAVNLILVCYKVSDNVWILFKTFGVMGLMIAFTILQTIYISIRKSNINKLIEN